uniref:Uncharacterized protein n=1 Tax=Aplanochytrium stocchinoi TaxID=215587 RepID=A0A7S3LIM7_9STRA
MALIGYGVALNFYLLTYGGLLSSKVIRSCGWTELTVLVSGASQSLNGFFRPHSPKDEALVLVVLILVLGAYVAGFSPYSMPFVFRVCWSSRQYLFSIKRKQHSEKANRNL